MHKQKRLMPMKKDLIDNLTKEHQLLLDHYGRVLKHGKHGSALSASQGIIGYCRPDLKPYNDPEHSAQGKIGHFLKMFLISHIVQLI